MVDDWNPDPKKFVTRMRKGEPTLVDKQIIAWRKWRKAKGEIETRGQARKDRKEARKRLARGSDKLVNIFGGEDE